MNRSLVQRKLNFIATQSTALVEDFRNERVDKKDLEAQVIELETWIKQVKNELHNASAASDW